MPMLRRVLSDSVADGTRVNPAYRVSAVNRRGRMVELQVAASPMRTEAGGISGIILVMDRRP
jgi:hypothetical protein